VAVASAVAGSVGVRDAPGPSVVADGTVVPANVAEADEVGVKSTSVAVGVAVAPAVDGGVSVGVAVGAVEAVGDGGGVGRGGGVRIGPCTM